MKTAEEFAKDWYSPDAIFNQIDKTPPDAIPQDPYSREFAEWLCNQYRAAMAKGIMIGQNMQKELNQLIPGPCPKCSGCGLNSDKLS